MSKQVVGLVLLVVGIILLYFGWQASQSIGDQVTEAVTGRFREPTMWYLIAGAAAIVAGGYIALVSKR